MNTWKLWVSITILVINQERFWMIKKVTEVNTVAWWKWFSNFSIDFPRGKHFSSRGVVEASWWVHRTLAESINISLDCLSLFLRFQQHQNIPEYVQIISQESENRFCSYATGFSTGEILSFMRTHSVPRGWLSKAGWRDVHEREIRRTRCSVGKHLIYAARKPTLLRLWSWFENNSRIIHSLAFYITSNVRSARNFCFSLKTQKTSWWCKPCSRICFKQLMRGMFAMDVQVVVVQEFKIPRTEFLEIKSFTENNLSPTIAFDELYEHSPLAIPPLDMVQP